MKKKSGFNVKMFSQTAMLSALTIVLSFLEGMLPELPVPGAKLGLANLAVMTATDLFGLTGGLSTTLVKSFFALVTRGPVAGFMSLCGSLLSMFVMWLFMRYDRKKFGYVGIGVMGAVSHNMGQLCVAAFLVSSSQIFYYMPILIVSGTVSGILIGWLGWILLEHIPKRLFY